MLSKDHYVYFQPQWYHDDGTNITYGDVPDGMWDFEAFLTKDICREWLKNNDYNPDDFVIMEYQDDDIEEVQIIDEYGENLDRVEDLYDDELADHIEDTVINHVGGIENLYTKKGDNETQQEYEDRIYGWALDLVNDAICEIEQNNDYNFQTYAGNPATDWYDEAREVVLRIILGYMTEGEPEEDL